MRTEFSIYKPFGTGIPEIFCLFTNIARVISKIRPYRRRSSSVLASLLNILENRLQSGCKKRPSIYENTDFNTAINIDVISAMTPMG